MNARIHPYLLMLIAVSIPLVPQYLGLMIGVLFLNWVIGLIRKEFAIIVSHRHVYMLIGFYVLHIISMLWTSNTTDGLFDMQVKLPFFFLPLIVGTNGLLRPKDLKNIAYAFIAGTTVAAIYNLTAGGIEYFEHHQLWKMFGKSYSRLTHLGYFALFLNICIAIIFGIFLRNRKYLNRTKVAWFIVLTAFLAGSVILTSSKNGIITLFAIIVFTGIYVMYRFRLWLTGGIVILLTVGSLTAFMLSSEWAWYRFEEMIESSQSQAELDPGSSKSTALRKFAWESSLDVIKENPIIGVGTGDVEDELCERYEEKNYTVALERRLNTHNQFLQSFAGLGIVGVILLTIILLHPIRIGLKRKSYVLTTFGLMIMFFALSESIFEVQSGVVIFSFFTSIYLFGIPRRYARGDAFLLIR